MPQIVVSSWLLDHNCLVAFICSYYYTQVVSGNALDYYAIRAGIAGVRGIEQSVAMPQTTWLLGQAPQG